MKKTTTGRGRAAKSSVAGDVQVVVATSGGRSSSRQRTRIVQRNGETVVHETATETRADEDRGPDERQRRADR